MMLRKTRYLLMVLTVLLARPMVAKAQADKAKRKPGEVVEVEIAPGVKMKFCWIPPGEAQLGSPKAEREEIMKLIKEKEEPEWLQAESEEVRGKYNTKGFWLAKYPVTQSEWLAVMGGKNRSKFVSTWEEVKKSGITDTSRFPVETVSWKECQAFIKKINSSVTLPTALGKGKFCLPHEDEWEYAARGGKGNSQAYYFGNDLNGKLANCDGRNSFGKVAPGPYLGLPTEVGNYEKVAPHPWGLGDMSGNIAQWCENKYFKNGDDNKRDIFVVRGGSWDFNSFSCRSASRYNPGPDDTNDVIGFRVCFRLE